MFDQKILPKTPGIARRLLAFSQLNGMAFDDKLVALASEDLVTQDDLKNLPFKLTSQGLYALQHIRDWHGRAMLLDSGNDRAREVALANIWLASGKTLILAQPNVYGEWASLIRQIWPQAKLSVFGNPRYKDSKQVYPEGVEFSDRPDFTADFFITSYGGAVWHDFCGHVTVDQTVVEELDHQNAINYRWDEAVRGLLTELPRPVFIQNIFNLPSDHGRDNLVSLQMPSSKAFNFIIDLVSNYLWSGIPTARPFLGHTREIEEYLVSHSYQKYDVLKLLDILGVSSHLLDDVDGNMKPLIFWDLTIKHLRADSKAKRTDSGLHKILERERDLATQQGLSMASIASAALEGDHSSLTLIGGLMTTQWSNLKANHVKVTHSAIANRFSKSLILVNNQDLKRGLKLHFGATIDDLTTDAEATRDRFIQEQSRWAVNYGPKPLASLIVTLDELLDNPKLLDVANFLFTPEWNDSREALYALKALADQHGTRIVYSVISNTFEEAIYQQFQ